jgi:hypothetical protein
VYEVIYKDEKWWISKNGKILDYLGGFIDPVSPKVIVEMLEDEI